MLLRALFKRPARSTRTTLSATYRIDRIDLDHVRRYNRAFGFPGDAIALTFLYLLAQRAQLATMLACPIPFRIPGLIHVENQLAMHGPVVSDTPLTLTTTVTLPPPVPGGAVRCVLETRAFDGARLAFSCDSTYLIKRASRTGRGAALQRAAQPAAAPGEPLGQWTVARDAGRRYASLSGDWNPIHLWAWSARLMGLRAPIIHGMHTVAKACALLQQANGASLTGLRCRFTSPVVLHSEAVLLRAPQGGHFTVMVHDRVAVEGVAG
jgi:acyl dehydratase